MYLFYSPDISGGRHTLNEEESHHCVSVLRRQAGDTLHLIDGRGGLYQARIVRAAPKACEVEILSAQQEYGKHPYYLHTAIAPPKNADRYEFFLEKAAEIGIDCITPLLCERSERRSVKHEHSRKTLIAAAKQSLSAYVPDLQPMTDFSAFVKTPFAGVKCIAHCSDTPAKIPFAKAIAGAERILIAIGAEGDFSPSEIAQAQQNGFCEVSLGSRRLRTETAGIAACCIAAQHKGVSISFKN